MQFNSFVAALCHCKQSNVIMKCILGYPTTTIPPCHATLWTSKLECWQHIFVPLVGATTVLVQEQFPFQAFLCQGIIRSNRLSTTNIMIHKMINFFYFFYVFCAKLPAWNFVNQTCMFFFVARKRRSCEFKRVFFSSVFYVQSFTFDHSL